MWISLPTLAGRGGDFGAGALVTAIWAGDSPGRGSFDGGWVDGVPVGGLIRGKVEVVYFFWSPWFLCYWIDLGSMIEIAR